MEKTEKYSQKQTFQELKKLIELCRKIGVKEFKGMGYELKLTDDVPLSRYKRKKEQSSSGVDNGPVSDFAYSDEEALLWSSAGLPNEEGS